MDIVGTLSSIARRFVSKDLQTLHKAGYVKDDFSITKKGKNRLLALLLEKNMEEVAILAREEIAEDEAK